MSLNGKVNWRVGTVGLYESGWSIALKLGYLNRVSVNSFDKRLRSALLDEHSGHGLFSPHPHSNPLSLSRLLGEPNEVLRYRCLDHFLLPNDVRGGGKALSVNVFRYCALCIMRGYHSPIHQLPWVKLCPIHLQPLIESCPNCGKNISITLWPNIWLYQDSKSIYDNICCCDIWPSMRSLVWLPGFRKRDTRPITAYMNWLMKIESSKEAKLASAAISAIGRDAASNELQCELISIWSTIVIPPPSVKSFLDTSNCRNLKPVLMTLRLQEDQMSSMIELIKTVGFRYLEALFVIRNEYHNRKGAWDYVLKKLSKKFSGDHLRCLYELFSEQRKEFGLARYFESKEFNAVCHRFYYVAALIDTNNLIRECLYLRDALYGKSLYYFNGYPRGDESQLQNYDNKKIIQAKDILSVSYIRIVHSKSEWDSSISNFIERLLCYEALAFSSALIRGYHKYRYETHNIFESLPCDVIQHPYILATEISPSEIEVKIWRRHRPIVFPGKEDDCRDFHRIRVRDYLLIKEECDIAVRRDAMRRVQELFDNIRDR